MRPFYSISWGQIWYPLFFSPIYFPSSKILPYLLSYALIIKSFWPEKNKKHKFIFQQNSPINLNAPTICHANHFLVFVEHYFR